VVDVFSVSAQDLTSVRLPCPKPCAAGAFDSCWPEIVVREFVVEIQGHAKSDASVRRSLRNTVRVRNDLVRFNVPLLPNQACPT
jgi:hypothetical protein